MKKIFLGSVAFVMMASASVAADLYDPPPPEIVELPPVGGWYLRGHLGMSNQQVKKISHPGYAAFDTHEFLNDPAFDSGIIAGIGAGYQFNDWLRADAIVEYRGKADFSALDHYTLGADEGTNEYDGAKSEWLLMANAYVDLGNYNGFVPYVGAGLGASRNTISRLTDVNVPTAGVAYANDRSTWNLAWALHAGIGYQVTDRMTVELGYTYANLGDAESGTLHTYDGSSPGVPGKVKFKDITSHDFKLGMRYTY